MIISLLLSSFLTLVELNCENLFDTQHDVGKEDSEFLSDGIRHWTPTKYWNKLNDIGQEILSCSDDLPDFVALVEVENDSVLRDLTRRSLLRHAGYQYLMTESKDVRGVDVAFLYQPHCFRPLCYDYLEVPVVNDMRPTRDVLYVKGQCVSGDTLHVFVVHAPSRYGGELETQAYRLQVSQVILKALSHINDQSKVLIAGDFNDYADSPSIQLLCHSGLINVTRGARGLHGAPANYRYRGEWHSLDHVLVSPGLAAKVDNSYINDAPFLMEEEPTYGGKRPRRTFRGMRYQRGYSDHLPLVVRFKMD